MATNTIESDHEVSDEGFGFSTQEEKEIERELADVSFEELQKARSDGSHTARPKRGKNEKLGRANKNRPSELSCKAPVGRFREVIQAPKKVVRDPRFESLCGTLDPVGFRKRYNFLYDVELPAEKEKLQKLIKKSKDKNVIEELKNHISWIDKQIKSAPRRTAESEIISEHIKKEREAAKKGKRPYYLKKSDIRERKLIKKYGELKDQGKLESFIEKRRRKNASKDHRFMPYRKNSEGVQEIIIVINLEVLVEECKLIGEPKSYDNSSVAPQNRAALPTSLSGAEQQSVPPMYPNKGPIAKNEAPALLVPIAALNPYSRWTIKAWVTSKGGAKMLYQF